MPRALSILLVLAIIVSLPVVAQLKANFSSDKKGGCSPLIVRLTNQTTGASSSATYRWDLGNGNSSPSRDAQAVYTDEGSYTVTLTVTDGGNISAVHYTVTVYPHSHPDFSYTPHSVCGPEPVTFTQTVQGGAQGGSQGGSQDGSSTSIVNWLWDFGDGTTAQSSSAAAQHVYSASIQKTASLTTTDNFGCTDTVSLPVAVTVRTPAVSAFTSDKQVLCLVTDPVQFTSSSSGPAPLTYRWDFGDANTSTSANPGHSYAQKGQYTVTLTTTTAEGCSATTSQANYLNVADYSTDFTVPPAAICQNTGFTFTDRSAPSASSRVWSVDGVAAAYSTPLTYTFSTAGTHTVQLSNLFGDCPQSVSKTVVVNPLPAILPFDENITRNCTGINVLFTDNSPDVVSRSWNFDYYTYGSGETPSSTPTISQSFLYNQSYTVRLMVTDANQCTNTILQQVAVAKPSIGIYEPNPTGNTGCATPVTKTYAIQNQQRLQSWRWDFGDGGGSTDAMPTHTYTTSGMPVLYYTDIDGCSGSLSYNAVTISNPFPLDFSTETTTVCAGATVTFSSPSLEVAGATDVQWSFGDGGSGTSAEYAYNNAGAYTVTLTAKNAGGCQSSVTKTNYITVLPAPGTYGTHSNTCEGDRGLVTFTYTPGSATSVLWNFGDGVTTTTGPGTQSVQHTYTASGTYYPEISGSNGQCSNSNSDRVMVLKVQQPKLTAGSPFACAGGTLDVQLVAERNPYEINSGYADDYTPQFLYGDGTPFTGTVAYTDYNQPYSDGAFRWTLSGFTAGKSGLQVVTTSFGFACTDVSNTIPLTIRGSATAAFTVISDDHCYQTPVTLQDASTPGLNNSILSEYWEFGDGQSSHQQGGIVSHTYSDPGQYAVRLTVTDAEGCSNSSGANLTYVSVNGPAVRFSPSETDIPLNTTVSFYNTSNLYGTTNVQWAWDFGDGSVSSEEAPNHTYTAAGVYTVTLQGMEAGNCVGSAVATITVKNFNSHFQVAASYVGTAGCLPVLAQFYNTSSNYVSVSWDFGDGATAGNVNTPSHVYTTEGKYIVTLSVQGYNGLTATYTDSVLVRKAEADVFVATPLVCLGQQESYQATAHAAHSYTWDFGDGTVATAQYPDSVITHTYTLAGEYTVRLVITDTLGCAMAAHTSVNLPVRALPKLAVNPSSPLLCAGSFATLTASGASSYVWTPATGLDRADIDAPVAAPAASTVYQVVGTDAVGCQGTIDVNVTVVTKEKVTVTPDTIAVCDGSEIQLAAKGADSYYWMEDVIGTNQPGVVTARPSASGSYTVIGRDSHQCFGDTAMSRVTVLPVPSVNGGPDVEVLAGNPVMLSATGSADVTEWKWAPADALSCTDCAQPVSSPKKPEEYIVTVKNLAGCSATDTVEVKILCAEMNVRIPDAFSPNGDGNNDRFVVLGIGQVKHLVIYNRWGVKIWERSNFYPADAVSCWDGTVGGQAAAVGAYVYYVEMECPAGGMFWKRGTVLLVR